MGKRRAESGVASGKARETALGQRVAEVEADNARLSIEVATLQQLVRALGAHERDPWERDLAALAWRTACPSWPACRGSSPNARPTCRRTPQAFLGRLWSPFRWAPSQSPGTRSGIRPGAGDAAGRVPATVTVIEGGDVVEEVGAFSGCSSLRAITLPPNLAEIGHYAFYECTSLSKITLPPMLTEIGNCAFFGCTSLPDHAPAQY